MALLLVFVAMLAATLTPSHRYNPELQPYYDDYMSIVQMECRDDQLNFPIKTKISFVESFDSEIIGQCGRAMAFWKISILKPEWRKMTEDQKVELMFHELSHCILEKDHVENPHDYMYTSQSDADISTIREQVRRDAYARCRR